MQGKPSKALIKKVHSLITEGILNLVPFPTKGAKSFSAENLNFTPITESNLICTIHFFPLRRVIWHLLLAMGLKSKYASSENGFTTRFFKF